MKSRVLNSLMSFILLTSVAGCVYYFKRQVHLYSLKTDTAMTMKLEKEQTFRIHRAKPLKVFRPPRVIPNFVVSIATVISERLMHEELDAKSKSAAPALSEAIKKVEQIEDLTKMYIKDPYILREMKAFGYVSNTLTARLLAAYNALSAYPRRADDSEKLKQNIRSILIENSEVAYFEIMITFEDTLSAFPDVALNLLDLVESLNVSSDEKISYYSAYLDRKLSSRVTAQDIDRERSVHLALEKLRKQGLDDSQIKTIVENFISKNESDARKRKQALSISKIYFPEYTESDDD